MRLMLKRHWFLACLVVVLSGGLWLGAVVPPATLRSETGSLAAWLGALPALAPRPITWIVLFLMAWTLDSRHIVRAIRSPTAVGWGTVVNAAIVPLLAWPLSRLQTVPDFSYGLMIAASVPSTLATSTVWTRKAGGNDAVSLLITLVTNGLCFIVAPFWLELSTGSRVALDPLSMVVPLLWIVLLPTGLGQGLRQWPAAQQFADRHRVPLGVASQLLVLSFVFLAAWNAGTQLNRGGGSADELLGGALVWACVIAVHVTAFGIALAVGRSVLRIEPSDLAAVAIAGSQKTLPIGVLLATDPQMFGSPDLIAPGIGAPLAVFPMLMYHASQLFIDAVFAERMRRSIVEDSARR